jgi:hypothetical protein
MTLSFSYPNPLFYIKNGLNTLFLNKVETKPANNMFGPETKVISSDIVAKGFDFESKVFKNMHLRKLKGKGNRHLIFIFGALYTILRHTFGGIIDGRNLVH